MCERVGARVCHNVAELQKGRLVLEVSCIVKAAGNGDLLDITLLFIHGTRRAWFGVVVARTGCQGCPVDLAEGWEQWLPEVGVQLQVVG